MFARIMLLSLLLGYSAAASAVWVRLISLSRRYDPRHWEADPLLAEAQARARDLESRDVGSGSWTHCPFFAKPARTLSHNHCVLSI